MISNFELLYEQQNEISRKKKMKLKIAYRDIKETYRLVDP